MYSILVRGMSDVEVSESVLSVHTVCDRLMSCVWKWKWISELSKVE